MIQSLVYELQSLHDPVRVEILQKFFQTGPGQYGEGDQFLGLKVPPMRKIAKKYYKDMSLEAITSLLESPIHEYRFVALIILTYQFQMRQDKRQKTWDVDFRKPQLELIDLYCSHTHYINNRDLVDVSAPQTLGAFLLDEADRSILYDFAASDLLWERRIAMIASFAFIKQDQFDDALALAKALLYDHHDLMHKAVGWMLREIGKRSLAVEEDFLMEWYQEIPRTMLRYAIEKFPEARRQQYLKGEV